MGEEIEPQRVNIRTRLSVWNFAIVAIALVAVGIVLFTVQRANVVREVTDELDQAVAEFEILATEGVDPATGEPFEDPSRLLEVSIQRSAIGQAEGEIGIVGGDVLWTAPPGVTLRPEEDAALMQHILPLSQENYISSGTFKGDLTNYAYVVAPVVFPESQQSGALVHVFDMKAEFSVVNTIIAVYAVVSSVLLLLIALVIYALAGRMLQPIESLRQAAESISQEDLETRVPVTGSDDLTRLTITINGMLDRVSSLVKSQRQLLDDVGHELRTPVTVVRGHLEVMDPTNPEDVLATRDIATSELDRMGGLITDLLTLAKSNAPDFVQLQTVDVAELTKEFFEKVAVLSDHNWQLAEVAEITAELDPNRITQAWMQLAANAQKYSEPGTTITIGSEEDDGNVELWVQDEGIGIAKSDMTLIRSRFGRANAGKAQADGVGLGLSIVESILKPHRGDLQIQSIPALGSKFTMVIPLAPQQKDGNEYDFDH